MTKPETLCTGCGATVTKGMAVKGDGFWRDVTGGIFCSGEWGKQHSVDLPSADKCSFSIGDTVRWMGQDGPKVGTVRKITHPENSGFVLWIGDGEMEDFPLVESQVSPELPPVAIKPESEEVLKYIRCEYCDELLSNLGSAFEGENGSVICPKGQTFHSPIRQASPQVVAKPEVSEPTPGSVWVLEKETVRFIKIATEGRNCTSIAIKKSDGSVLSVELQSWIGEDSKPMVQA